MAWSNEKIQMFQNENNIKLAEINASLRPNNNLKNKVGIFCHGQIGDLATIMSILNYRNEIFKEMEIIFYCNYPNADLLQYAPISEVRPWLWAGNGLPEGTPDFYPLLCNEHNRLNKELASKYESTKDLEDGYFPAPHMLSVEKRHGINYPNISKMIFGVNNYWEWHPLLSFSDEERETAKNFINKIPRGRIIIMETFCGSEQSKLNHDMVIQSMKICNDKWGDCNFIFVSHKYLNKQYDFPENFFNEHVVSAAHFSPRQCALLANYCDLFISTSSGISVTSSCWGNKPFPMLQYCGSEVCGTKELAVGPIEQVFSDHNPNSQKEFYDKLHYLCEYLTENGVDSKEL